MGNGGKSAPLATDKFFTVGMSCQPSTRRPRGQAGLTINPLQLVQFPTHAFADDHSAVYISPVLIASRQLAGGSVEGNVIRRPRLHAPTYGSDSRPRPAIDVQSVGLPPTLIIRCTQFADFTDAGKIINNHGSNPQSTHYTPSFSSRLSLDHVNTCFPHFLWPRYRCAVSVCPSVRHVHVFCRNE